MNVLCALGARDGAAMVERLLRRVDRERLELLLLFVIDDGPRHGLEALRGPLHRGPRLGPKQRGQMADAEQRSGEIILAEAQAAARDAGLGGATTRLLHGRPERVIVDQASQGFELVVVSAREGLHRAIAGPESVGHVARYVLDHAPCDVLLIRG